MTLRLTVLTPLRSGAVLPICLGLCTMLRHLRHKVSRAQDVQRIVAHNGIGFDYPVMSKLWDVDWSGYELMDSLVLSRLANPSREAGHSLRQWGERLGFPKGDHEDWSQLSCEMVKYCEQDVAVTVRVLECLQDELVGFSEESVKLEHDVQRIIQQQIKTGWLIDARSTLTI